MKLTKALAVLAARRWGSRVLLATAVGLQAGCGGETPAGPGEDEQPEPPPEAAPVIARINGPTEARLLFGEARARYDGTFSEGPVAHYLWFVREKGSERSQTPTAEGLAFEPLFTTEGTFLLTLRVESTAGDADEAEMEVASLPFGPKTARYDVPLTFFRTETMGGKTVLAFKTYGDALDVREVAPSPFLRGDISWEPTGERIVIAAGASPNIHLIDVTSGAVLPLVTVPGQARAPVWNPKKDWIAYTDDTQTPNRAHDELFLVRPDGTGMKRLSGAEYDDTFCAWHPSWDPDGERLAESAHYGNLVEAESYGTRRLAIVSELWTDAPVREFLHSDAMLSAFLETHFGITYSPALRLTEGAAGVAWSPDGEWIVYTLGFDFGFGAEGQYHRLLVKAPASGSGPITILVAGSIQDDPNHPTWSPNGRRIFLEQGGHIISVWAEDGSDRRDHTTESGYLGWWESSPTWYH